MLREATAWEAERANKPLNEVVDPSELALDRIRSLERVQTYRMCFQNVDLDQFDRPRCGAYLPTLCRLQTMTPAQKAALCGGQ